MRICLPLCWNLPYSRWHQSTSWAHWWSSWIGRFSSESLLLFWLIWRHEWGSLGMLLLGSWSDRTLTEKTCQGWWGWPLALPAPCRCCCRIAESRTLAKSRFFSQLVPLCVSMSCSRPKAELFLFWSCSAAHGESPNTESWPKGSCWRAISCSVCLGWPCLTQPFSPALLAS